MDSPRKHAPATLRNRDPLLTELARIFPPPDPTLPTIATSPIVLELASGSGEHAAYFAERLPYLVWQPSDLDADARRSIDAWCSDPPRSNVRSAIELDARWDEWPIDRADGVVCINMIHISRPESCTGLLRGAAILLRPGCPLILYGPFRVDGLHTSRSNEEFDASLRARDPMWGVRDLDEVEREAASFGFIREETIAMPANNLTVVFRRT